VNKQTENLYEYEEDFRNALATVDAKGDRVWVYPKKPSGPFHSKRVVVTILLLSIFFVAPFSKVGGQPLLLLNVFERKFVLFGSTFWPQDFFLLAITLIAFFVFVILFTVVFGRVWCGWACPQTLFMEMVFRKIEYWIEGDANAQRRLDHAPWDTRKILKKVSKQLIFILISVVIAHTALAYLIGVEQVQKIISESPTKHLAGFIGLVGFTGIFYGVFARFREQACIAVCPYGRLQGVLLGKESIVIAYDWLRGEPRGKIRKQDLTTNKGDCIDCNLCVHVCPTGIDIRNGTQLECVNCTACIDACDEVMVKIGKPTGLVRFASYRSITEGIQQIITSRVISYSIVLLLLLVVLGFLVVTRSEIETTMLKISGTLYQRDNVGMLSNLYSLEFVNKTNGDVTLSVKIESPTYAVLEKVGRKLEIVPARGMVRSVYFVKIPEEKIKTIKTNLVVGVYRDDEKIETVRAKFIGPIHSNLMKGKLK
jgi:cytochrome c oxidase accessory protein FixG